MAWAFRLSLSLHALLFIGLSETAIRDNRTLSTYDRTTIELVQRLRAAPPPTKIKTSAKRSANRLSNETPFEGDLGQQASSSNYIERIKPRIESSFWSVINNRRKIWRSAKISPKCQIRVIASINAQGEVLRMSLEESCEADAALSQGAVSSFNQGFPPPPKDLLVDGEMELEWVFRVAPSP